MTAALEELLSGLPADRTAGVGLRAVMVGHGVLGRLPDLLRDLAADRPGPVAVLSDAAEHRCANGERVKPAVVARCEQAGPVNEVRLPEDRVHADEATVAAVVARCAGAGILVTVGSGTLADLGKVAAAAHDLPHVVVQTATSVNGFADNQSVLVRSGAKRTTPSRWPEALVADTEVLAGAPADLNLAGIGDLLSMFTAPADWLLATSVGLGEPYLPQAVLPVRARGERLLELPSGVAGAQRTDLADLADLLAASGVSMGVSATTAPSSGMEHVISHLLEMHADSLARSGAWHGAQVGVATLVAAALWQRVREALADGRSPRPRLPDADGARRRTFAAFDRLDPSGRTSQECWTAYERKLVFLAAHQDRLEHVVASWRETDERLAPLLMPAQQLAAAVKGSSMPVRFSDLGETYDADTVGWAVQNGHRMRDRFTVADLADLLGMWSEADSADLLDELTSWGAGW